MQLLERIKTIFYNMATKSMMIYLQILRTNKALQAKPTNRYINMDGNGTEYTIGWQQPVNNI